MTGLPFVFACWISNKEISKDFLLKFNNSLKIGIYKYTTIHQKEYENIKLLNNAIEDYLNNKISYILDDEKRG